MTSATLHVGGTDDRVETMGRVALATQGLLYVRNYTAGLDVPWQRFFGTEDRSEVEARCLREGTEFSWKENGDLCTRQRCEAARCSPRRTCRATSISATARRSTTR